MIFLKEERKKIEYVKDNILSFIRKEWASSLVEEWNSV